LAPTEYSTASRFDPVRTSTSTSSTLAARYAW
jgi:hypothetical protein